MNDEIKSWSISCGPPEMGGWVLLSYMSIEPCYFEPDDDEYFSSKDDAIDKMIARLEELRDD